ncbi:MAG: hypothetical protein SFU83_14890 [Meiothermus sp.]|nr:hypothetical protein [Meiothermus sp.]
MEITLAGGRKVRLSSLLQYHTYEGWLEGFPTAEINARKVQGLVDQYTKEDEHAPLIVPYTETPIQYEGKYPFGTPQTLPSITCMGLFTDTSGGEYYSGLRIVWFQNEFALPIESRIVEYIRDVDWNRVARFGAI